jgi:hypothetical protein
VAAQLGYCGLDRRRVPLSGLELRGCWDAAPVRAVDAIDAVSPPLEGAEPRSPALRLRDFVPVELVRREAAAGRAAGGGGGRAVATAGAREPAAAGSSAARDIAQPRPDAVSATADRVTLFADAEL